LHPVSCHRPGSSAHGSHHVGDADRQQLDHQPDVGRVAADQRSAHQRHNAGYLSALEHHLLCFRNRNKFDTLLSLLTPDLCPVLLCQNLV